MVSLTNTSGAEVITSPGVDTVAKTPRRVYLSGPMRGKPEFNFPAFFDAALYLRAKGYEVFSPAERDQSKHGTKVWKDNPTGDVRKAAQEGFSLREALAEDLVWICHYADGIALLPGWASSQGALAELATARALGLRVMYLNPNGLGGYDLDEQ